MREVVLDLETTGFRLDDGHRIVEIGCVELIELRPTGATYQTYLNPERSVSFEMVPSNGLTDNFLSDKPYFADIADKFLAFVGDSTLVVHNALFVLKFPNSELQTVGRPPIAYAGIIDTIEIAKLKLPSARYSLDELCQRFGIDLSGFTTHGALIDAKLAAQVYRALLRLPISGKPEGK